MKNRIRSLFAMALVSALFIGQVHATIYTARGDAGQRLVLALWDDGVTGLMKLNFSALVTGVVSVSTIGDLGKLKTKFSDTASNTQLGVMTSVAKWNTSGSVILTPSIGATVTLDSHNIDVKSAFFQVSAVPESETYALMLVGLLGLFLVHRRKRLGYSAL